MAMARTPGGFRIAHRARTFELYADPVGHRHRRVRRILASIQQDIDEGCTAFVRQILCEPRELYRLELERPDMSYLRTTILDRDTLDELLEITPEQTVRDRFQFRS